MWKARVFFRGKSAGKYQNRIGKAAGLMAGEREEEIACRQCDLYTYRENGPIDRLGKANELYSTM